MRANVSISTVVVTALSLVPSALALVPRVPKTSQVTNVQKADEVKAAFQFAWEGYYKYAFPHDELHPVSNTWGNSRNGWGASAADALSTALVMELPEVVDQILEHLANVDFSKTDTDVSLFETTIRYLAGMVSGYDLLNDEALSHLASNPDHVDALLTQAQALAEEMKFAFDTPSGVPHNSLNITDQTTDESATNGLAVTGTLVLEWTRLSDLTGNQEYAELTQLAESYLLDPKPAESEPYEGLVGSSVNISTGLFADTYVSWSGGADSFYEYLLKMYIYDTEQFALYGERWEAAAKSSIDVLFSETTGENKVFFMAELDGQDIVKNSQHLTCFDGGNFILGGQVFNNQEYLDAGLKLVDGCRATYAATATGIGPETFGWSEDEVPDDQVDFFEREGFFITGSTYNMRPEVIESYYYAFRATGDEKYRDWAWEAFVAINATTRTSSGFSAIDDVNSPDGGEKTDNQESFLFAEVMKYLYLIFAPESDWQVDTQGNNKYVYNTEAHPVKIAKTA